MKPKANGDLLGPQFSHIGIMKLAKSILEVFAFSYRNLLLDFLLEADLLFQSICFHFQFINESCAKICIWIGNRLSA